ncbi:MAG: hypothetical protein AWU54_1087 [Candidatus Frackibacter sp. T328-2]|nr:MAG: hypothetical protein AWU54_1087 [Candidatus Frackibacter sp. T328-2]
MKLRTKSLLVIICLISIILTSTIALANNEQVLTVSQAINAVFDDNTDLQIADLELANAKIEYQKSKASNLTTQSNYSEMRTKLNLMQAQNQYYQDQVQLIKEVLTDYAEVVLAEKNVKIKRKKLELEKIRLDKTKAQFEKGHKNNLDLIEQTNTYHDAKANFEESKDNYSEAIRELRFIINQNQQQSLNLQVLKKPELWQITEAEVLNVGFENNSELKIEAMQIKVAKQGLIKAQQSLTSRLDLEKAKNNLQIAKLKKEESEEDIRKSLYVSYYNFKQAINKLSLRQEDLNRVKENHNMITKKEENGLASQEEVLASEVQLLEAKQNYQSVIIDYYKKYLELKSNMELEVEGLINDLTQS